MSDIEYARKVQCSVSNFIICEDEVLLLHRGPHKKLDPNRLNAPGGRVESGENFLQAVARETEEETGLKISLNKTRLVGVVRLEGGYDEDWIMCHYVSHVDSKDLPLGSSTEDGELIWLPKNEVQSYPARLVDDVEHCWDLIMKEELFFADFQLNDDLSIKSSQITLATAS